MPRAPDGSYALPAGNPVVSGTTIESNWANTTMPDLAQAMTESLSRNGEGGMLVPFQNQDGTAGNPGVTWTNEVTSGFYRAGNNDMRVSIAGVDVARWVSGNYQIWEVIAEPDPEAPGQWRNLAQSQLFLPLAGGEVTGQIKGITPVDAEDLTRKDFVEDNFVGVIGDQDVGGIKNFTSLPTLNSNPANANQAVRKEHLDTQIDTRYKGNIAGDKTINVSTSNPSGGVNGDLWIVV